MDQKWIVYVLVAMLVSWRLYRRVQRNIGRQRIEPGRMKFRIGIFVVIGAVVAFVARHDGPLLGAMLAGIAGGALLAWIGLRETKFEATPQGRFYTPHLYIGLFVSGLFIARLAYRFLSLSAAQVDPNPFSAYQKSPLTLAIFGVVIGYYVFYLVGVLRTYHLAPSGDAARERPPA